MAAHTDRWGLSILGPGDSIQDDGYKFADADRRLMDRLLTYATETHHHTGDVGTDNTPASGLNLILDATGGSMLAGNRYYYRYTVVDATGNESAPSPIQSIGMPLEVTAPQAPSPVPIIGTGALLPGTYSYVCSAYKDVNTNETKAVNSAAIRVTGSSPNNSVQLTLPDLPPGASGLNVYRKKPNGFHYLYLASVAAPAHGDLWLDDGNVEDDCDRTLPAVNRTSSENMVTLAYPGATPAIPDGWSWRIYRTTNPNDWSRSYLTELGPQGSPPFTPTVYPDTGGGTQIGAPPTKAQVIKAPSKIMLTDSAEVQGDLPPGRLAAPHIITFINPGIVTTGVGTFVWVCDYDLADIIQVRAYLGVGSQPAAKDVIVDVNAYRPSQGSSTWQSIFADGPTRPRIPVGQTVGVPTVPSIVHLEAGDALCVDRDQAGGGATPTDKNLTVAVMMYTKYGSEDQSYVWETNP